MFFVLSGSLAIVVLPSSIDPSVKRVSVRIPVEEDCGFKGTGRLQLMKAETDQNQLSYSSSGPRELWPSVSNYVLQLSTTDHPRSSITYLYFLDSGGGSYPEVLSKAQVEWFRGKSREINPDSRYTRKSPCKTFCPRRSDYSA